MKVQIGKVFISQKALGNLAEQKLPINVSYKLNKLIRKFSTELEVLDKQRNTLIRELSTKENPNEVASDKLDTFYKEFDKVLQEESEIEFTKISLKSLGDITISSNDLALLEWLLEDDMEVQ